MSKEEQEAPENSEKQTVQEAIDSGKAEETEAEKSDGRPMFKAKCAECGNDCEVPFKPKEGRDVFCQDCYKKRRTQRRFGGKRRFGNRPREMHDATCSECGKECQVPFKPSGDKPVRCKECYIKMKESENQ